MTESTNLLKTPFYDLHVEAGARMVPFAGYDMPVQYPMGIKKEHLHTREKAGLFDVSHMGQVKLKGEKAAQALEALVPVDIIDLSLLKQRYALFTNDKGGVLDDLMVTCVEDGLFLVVNAACKEQDIAHLKANLDGSVEVEVLDDKALLALQGPEAKNVMAKLAPESQSMTFMTAKSLEIGGIKCFVTRSGYTGEDGFEISVANDQAVALAKMLLAEDAVEWIGLGARDSLRLEAGLCLYGHELTTEITPIEASLNWAISKARRPDGARAGGYPGADVIGRQMLSGAPRKRVAILPQGKMPVRDGAEIVTEGETLVGIVTSGGFGPSLNVPIAMALLDKDAAQGQQPLFAMVRGKAIPVEITPLPFVKQNYYRGAR
ncbi:glycine cleavage system aminomethyltransferase GcvT [Hydrogenovibrio marinus]|uniref:aminomethyltransferase n=1 Tax=Hydrogenovibrio marinus TaxID=28885 RepID=A0A066ZLY2_HYDMR|nr:glycine cleavage system aminomethyltransferase GcvT [Hydrogenovibrio marinus]KDN94818.1 glycine cleavage system protein T [Hydrogenovibrio marinus]BBN59276.1 aminomethyltransferase [Hydrogenovibrio marinus]